LPNIELGHYRPVSSSLEELFESPPPATSGIPGYISEDEFARLVNRQPSTLRRSRKQHFGPTAVRIGPDFYYRETAPQDLLDAEMAKAEAERAPPRRGRPRKGGPMPRTERRRATPPGGKIGGADDLTCDSGKPGDEPGGDVRDGATARGETVAEVSRKVYLLAPSVGGGATWIA
jgi:hypothetical protein